MIATAALLLALTVSPTGDHTPPCQNEDGPGRCVWDGRHMGNGTGSSYVVHRDETINYITHRRAHRLMTTSR